MEKVFEIYIKTSPERLWDAIPIVSSGRRYSFGSRVSSDWTQGSTYTFTGPDGESPWGHGENLEVDPPRRLVQSFNALVRRRRGRRHLAGHLRDRAVRGLVPAHGDPRPASRGGERRAVRRLADDPVGPEDADRDRRGPHHAGDPALRRPAA